jgi:hypothetical protein
VLRSKSFRSACDKRDYLVCVFRRRNISSRGNTKRPIVIRIFGYGYSKGFVSRLGKVPFEPPVKAPLKDSDINTISKKGNKLTFKATAFKARNNTYRVNIRVLQKRFDRGFESNPPETAYKTLVVTVTEVIEKKGNIEELIMEDDNAKVTAQAVRKESKSASKLLLSKVGKTLMGRLSHIRHKNKQKSSFSANGTLGRSASEGL